MHKISFTVKDLEGFSFSIDSDHRDEMTAADFANMAADVFNESGMVKISRDEYESLTANQWPDGAVTAITSPDEGYLPMLAKERQELINEVAQKPTQVLTQIDWFNRDTGAGDTFLSASVELRKSVCMRLYAPAHYTKDDMIAGLTKILEWVKTDGDFMQDETRKTEAMYRDRYLDAINPYANYADAVSADNDDDVRPF